MENKAKDNRGGKRIGAGRPARKVKGVGMHFVIDEDIHKLLLNMSNKSQFVNSAIKEKAEKDNIHNNI